jgi:hypothetical protein
MVCGHSISVDVFVGVSAAGNVPDAKEDERGKRAKFSGQRQQDASAAVLVVTGAEGEERFHTVP